MASTFTTRLRLEKQGDGENDSTWGDKVNLVFDLLDDAIAGYEAISVAGGDVILSNNNGTSDQARKAILKFTGSPGTTRTVTAPGVAKKYVIWNATSDGSAISFTASGNSVTIYSGEQVIVFSDGTDCYIVGENNAKLIGEIVAWPLDTPPARFLECDGSAISRTTYSALFAVLGTTYGAGDGSTTFNLPDYRGQFLRGWAHGEATDPDRSTRTDRGDGTTGDNIGTKQGHAFASHRHDLNIRTSGANASGSVPAAQNPYNTTSITSAQQPVQLTGGNETRPRNVNVMYCIRFA